MKINESVHILTLVVNRDQDVPRIRSKTKLLAKELGFPRLAVIQLATAASEAARLLHRMFDGGKMRISVVSYDFAKSCGLEFIFIGRNRCLAKSGPSCPIDMANFSNASITGLRKVFDQVTMKEGDRGSLRLYCLKCGLNCSWQHLRNRAGEMKNLLFVDTEESYVENLRAKHEEVLKLLAEKSAKNIELDRVNLDLLQLNQELEALANERTIGEMALKIADQVRNPASVIGGLARLLKKKLPDLASKEYEKLKAIATQAGKLEEIVRSFETLADKQSRYFLDEDLNEIVKEAAYACSAMKLKGVDRRLVLADVPITIKANRPILKIAILHILRNSSDVSTSGSVVEIKVENEDGQPIVSVADQGEGFPAGIREKLFFGPVESRKSGTGLGLLIVNQIMEEHQGSVKIVDREGGGTIVLLEFPIRWQEKM